MPHANNILDSAEAAPAVVRGGATRASAYVLGMLLSVVSASFLIRHLGVDDYGRFGTVIQLTMIVAGLTDAGLTNIGIRDYAANDDSAARERLIRALLGLRGTLTIAGVLIAAAFVAIGGYGYLVAVGTLISGVGLIVGGVQATYSVPLATGLKLGRVSAIEFLRQAATAGLIIAFVVLGASLVPFFVVAVLAALVVLVPTVLLTSGQIPRLPSLELGAWRQLLQEILPYAAASAIGVIYFRVSVILMPLISNYAESGYLNASFRIVDVLSGVPFFLFVSLFPVLARAARLNTDRFRYTLQRASEVAIIVGAWVAFSAVLGAAFAVETIAGPDFNPSIEVLRIQGLALAGTFLVSAWSFALLSLRDHGGLLKANGFALCLAVGSTIVLGSAEGARGAALAMVVTEFALVAIYGVMLARLDRQHRVSFRVLPRVLLATAVSVVPIVLLDVPSLPAMIAAGVLYFAILALLKAFPPEISHAIRIRRRKST